LGRVNLGYHSGPAANDEARQKAIVGVAPRLFHQAGIESRPWPTHNARWHKLVWNVPYKRLSVLLGAFTGDDGGRIQPRTDPALMAEVVQGAHACGHDSASYAEQMFP
jgi:2-dehydropantoate 2-reductase